MEVFNPDFCILLLWEWLVCISVEGCISLLAWQRE